VRQALLLFSTSSGREERKRSGRGRREEGEADRSVCGRLLQARLAQKRRNEEAMKQMEKDLERQREQVCPSNTSARAHARTHTL
jgi:hypothetical protein